MVIDSHPKNLFFEIRIRFLGNNFFLTADRFSVQILVLFALKCFLRVWDVLHFTLDSILI